MKTITLEMPDALDDALYMMIRTLEKDGTKCTKAELIIKLMRIGLIKESAKLINEGRTKL